MSWLISLVLAGAMFAADGSNVPVQLNYNESDNKKIVRIDETERFEQTYPLNANGRVSVSNVNGSIAIETWDKSEVKLEYVKTADSRERLSEVEVRIDTRADSIRIETDYDKTQHGGSERSWKNNDKLVVEYKLIVPRGAVLDEIETVNGSITIANASNMTKASAVNGEVRATNLRGTANLSTVNGTVQADFDQLQSGSKISLDTVNGTVNLVIPSDANATVKADTLNGSITNDFGLPVRKGQYIGRDLHGKIGSGDVQIKLNSVNGGLSVKRKNDGKNISPATNLLQQKSNSDNGNDTNDEENGRSFPPIPPMPPMPKINQKDIDRAMRDAQKEIAKIQPALEKLQIDARRQATLANYFNGAPIIEKKSESFNVKGITKVTIEARGCSVAVRGWDKQEVQYSVVKIAENRNNAPLDIKAAQNDSGVSIKVINTDGTLLPHGRGFFDHSSNVRIEVFVPKKSNLKIINDGEIRLEGVSGEIDLQGVDEAVNVRDVDGKLSIGTSDGRIRLIGFRGAFDGRTRNGEMNLEGDFQSFNALSSDGTIVLTMPENADAILEANTEIENEGLSLIRDKSGKKLWRIGKGGTTYRINVEEGKIIVRNSNDLKSIF